MENGKSPTLWWVAFGKRTYFVQRIKEGRFCTACFFWTKFFKFCILMYLDVFVSWCIEYWIHFQNIYTFTCQKTWLQTLLLLFLLNETCLFYELRNIYIYIYYIYIINIYNIYIYIIYTYYILYMIYRDM